MNIQMIGSANLSRASCTVRMPEIVNITGASMPVIPNGTHSVTHQTTIHNIVPRASCGENAGTDLFNAALAMLSGRGIRIVATNSKGPTISPMFSFLENQFPLLLSRDRSPTLFHHVILFYHELSII